MLQMCTTITNMYCRAIIISAWAPKSCKWLPRASLWCTTPAKLALVGLANLAPIWWLSPGIWCWEMGGQCLPRLQDWSSEVIPHAPFAHHCFSVKRISLTCTNFIRGETGLKLCLCKIFTPCPTELIWGKMFSFSVISWNWLISWLSWMFLT